MSIDDREGCPCGDCGHRYRVDLTVPDEVWVRIGMAGHGGMLCGSCLMRRVEHVAQAEGGFGYVTATEAGLPGGEAA